MGVISALLEMHRATPQLMNPKPRAVRGVILGSPNAYEVSVVKTNVKVWHNTTAMESSDLAMTAM